PTKARDLEAASRTGHRPRSRSAVCSREPPIPAPLECAATGSPVAVAHSIAVAATENLDAGAGATSTPLLRIANLRQKADALPGVSPLTALPPFPRTRSDSRQTASQPERDSDGSKPVGPFVVGLCPAPPVAPKRAATALQRSLA